MARWEVAEGMVEGLEKAGGKFDWKSGIEVTLRKSRIS